MGMLGLYMVRLLIITLAKVFIQYGHDMNYRKLSIKLNLARRQRNMDIYQPRRICTRNSWSLTFRISPRFPSCKLLFLIPHHSLNFKEFFRIYKEETKKDLKGKKIKTKALWWKSNQNCSLYLFLFHLLLSVFHCRSCSVPENN